MADEEVKINAFGKTYGKVGDEKTNLCLATAGDVKIKTANSYVTIFKNGKLNVDDTKVVYTVSSMDEAKKNALYVIGEATSEDEESEETETSDEDSDETKESKKDVYLYIDGETILLASTSDAYISYGIEQALTAEQFLRALKNIGFYFATLEDAKKTSITDGLVYILEEGKMYKVIGGEYIDYLATEEEEPTTEEEPEEIKTLTVGNIFLDGEKNFLNSSKSFAIKVNNNDYLTFKSDQIDINKDVVLDSGITIESQSSYPGEQGFMIYTEDDNVILEVDTLIVHNGFNEYSPSLTNDDIFSEKQNIILSAEESDDQIAIELKYDNTFNVGDRVAFWVTLGTPVEIDIVEIESNDTETIYNIIATANYISSETKIKIVYQYIIYSDDGEGNDIYTTIEDECEITMNMLSSDEEDDDEEDDDDDNSVFASGNTEITITNSDIDDISVVSMSILSGDTSLYYGTEIPLPSCHFATIASLEPLEISPDTKLTNTEINELANSKIVLIYTDSFKTNVLYRNGDTLERGIYNDNNVFTASVKIGELGSDEYANDFEFNGDGIYTELFFSKNVFAEAISCETLSITKKLARYEESVDESSLDDGKTIPNINMVNMLIQNALENL